MTIEITPQHVALVAFPAFGWLANRMLGAFLTDGRLSQAMVTVFAAFGSVAAFLYLWLTV